MIYWYFLVAFLLLGTLVVRKQYFTVLFLYSLVWFLGITLLYFSKSVVVFEVSSKFELFLVFHFAFALCIYIFFSLIRPKKSQSKEKLSNTFILLTKFFILLSFILVIIFAFNILRSYSNLLLNEPWSLRYMYFNGEVSVFPSISYTIIFLYVSSFLSSAVLYTRLDNGLKIFYLPIFTAIIFAFVYLGRNEFFKVSIVYTVAFLLRDVRFVFRKMLRKGLLIFGVILILSGLLDKGSNLTGRSNLVENTIINLFSYSSGSLLAFDLFTNRVVITNSFGYGEYTFYPIFRRLSSIGLYKKDFEVSYVNDYEGHINTFTYLRPFYSDFGWIGVYTMSSLFLVLIAYYSTINKRPSNSFGFLVLVSLYPAVLFSIQGLEYQTMEFFSAIFFAFCVSLFNKVKLL